MKKTLTILAVIFALLIAIALAIPYVVSSDFLKPRVLTELNAISGKKISLDGDFRFSVLPTIGVHATRVGVMAPAQGKLPEEKLMDLGALDVELSVVSLITSGNVVIQSLKFEDANISLHVDKAGNANWTRSRVIAPAKQDVPPAGKAEKKNLFADSLWVDSISVKNASVTYKDDRSKKTWAAEKINAKLSLDGLASAVTIEGDTVFNQKPVSVKANIHTLESLLEQNSGSLEATIKTELATAELKGVISGPGYKGDIALKTPSLTALAQWINQAPLGTPGTTPLALDVKGQLDANEAAIRLTGSTIKLDEIQATGSLGVSFDQGSTPVVMVDLATNTIDANPYMPAEAKAGGKADTGATPAAVGWSTEPIDLSFLQLFAGTLNLRSESIKFQNVQTGKATIQAKLERGRLGLDIVETEIAGGKLSLLSKVDGNVNAIGLQLLMDNVQIDKLLNALGQKENVTGQANVSLAVNMIGRNQKEMAENSHGQGGIALANGTIKGFNLIDIMGQLRSVVKPSKSDSQITEFSVLSGSFNLNSGQLENKDLVLKSKLMDMTGSGTANLPARTLNFTLKPVLSNAKEGRAAITVPVRITGNWDAPSFAPDAGAVIKDVLSDPSKYKDVIKSPEIKDTKDKLKGLLKKL